MQGVGGLRAGALPQRPSLARPSNVRKQAPLRQRCVVRATAAPLELDPLEKCVGLAC